MVPLPSPIPAAGGRARRGRRRRRREARSRRGRGRGAASGDEPKWAALGRRGELARGRLEVETPRRGGWSRLTGGCGGGLKPRPTRRRGPGRRGRPSGRRPEEATRGGVLRPSPSPGRPTLLLIVTGLTNPRPLPPGRIFSFISQVLCYGALYLQHLSFENRPLEAFFLF